MGWDAYAHTSREAADTGKDRDDPLFSAIFIKAHEELVRRTGRGGQIWDATLGGSSRPFLQCAVPLTCFDLDIPEGRIFWSKETVVEAHAKADWNFTREDRFRGICNALYKDPLSDEVFDLYYDKDDFEYEKWEVRLFLEACAENGLVIEFTW
jgi:hypothetical protein